MHMHAPLLKSVLASKMGYLFSIFLVVNISLYLLLTSK